MSWTWGTYSTGENNSKERCDGSNCWFGKEAGAVASALVLSRDAQDVRQGFDSGKDADARAGIVWGTIGMEAGIGRKRRVSLRFVQLAKVRTAARIGRLFESTLILPLAEKLD